MAEDQYPEASWSKSRSLHYNQKPGFSGRSYKNEAIFSPSPLLLWVLPSPTGPAAVSAAVPNLRAVEAVESVEVAESVEAGPMVHSELLSAAIEPMETGESFGLVVPAETVQLAETVSPVAAVLPSVALWVEKRLAVKPPAVRDLALTIVLAAAKR